MSFIQKTLTSAIWSFSAGYANILIGFLGNLVLARILVPDDFGIFALALSFLMFVTMLTGFGSQEAIMQCRDESIVDLISTAFWISLFIGLIIGLIGVFLGVIIYFFYNSTIGLIIIILAALTPFSSVANAYAALFRRNMVYKPVALSQTSANIISFTLSIWAALAGMGVWSLLLRQCLVTLIYWLGLLFATDYRFTYTYSSLAMRWIWDFGWKKMAMQINDVIFGHYDHLMIGLFIGTAQLGFYGQAYRLAWLGQQFTQGALNPILLPMFATVQFSPDKLRFGFHRVFYWVFRIIPVLGIMVLFVGKEAVILLYGEKWLVAGIYFQTMFVFFMFLPLTDAFKNFLVGAGFIKHALHIGWVQVALLVLGVTIGALLEHVMSIIWVVNLSYLLAALLMGWATQHIISVDWGYLMTTPVTGFLLMILIGSQLQSLIAPTFFGVAAVTLLLLLCYVMMLVLLEYSIIRHELKILTNASRN